MQTLPVVFNCKYLWLWCFARFWSLSPSAVTVLCSWWKNISSKQTAGKRTCSTNKVVSNPSTSLLEIAWGKNTFKESVNCGFFLMYDIYNFWQFELRAAKICPNCKDCKKTLSLFFLLNKWLFLWDEMHICIMKENNNSSVSVFIKWLEKNEQVQIFLCVCLDFR